MPNQRGVPLRYRPGTVALREIRKRQQETNLLIPKLPFSRLVREISTVYLTQVEKDQGRTTTLKDWRFTADAMSALQSAAEGYLIDVFQEAQVLAIHANRTTITVADLALSCSSMKGD